MAHELESGFFGGNVPAWHGLGTVIEDDTVKSSEAIELAGLNWQVEKVPAKYEVPNPTYNPPSISEEDMADDAKLVEWELALMEYEKENPEYLQFDIPNQYVNVRNTDHRALGVVGDRYEILQNNEAFEFGDALVDSGDAKWHTAGSLKLGSVVWMLMKLPQDIKIGGLDDERIEQFILISNSHDGSSAITVAVTPVRVVCQNTLSLALKGNQRVYKVRHTKTMEGRLAEARKSLELTFEYGKAVEALGNKLLEQSMSKSEFVAWMDAFIPMPEAKYVVNESGEFEMEGDEKKTVKQRGATMRDAMRTDISLLFEQSPNLENVRGTRWAGLQALIEYSDHHLKGRQQEGKTNKKDNRFLRITEGNKLVQNGLELLV